jgi:hypothetical protein
MEILERLLRRYVGDIDNPLAQTLLSRKEPEVAIRLELQTVHTWNFSQRMANLPVADSEKVCPE